VAITASLPVPRAATVFGAPGTTGSESTSTTPSFVTPLCVVPSEVGNVVGSAGVVETALVLATVRAGAFQRKPIANATATVTR
jgi:hypothetical protein